MNESELGPLSMITLNITIRGPLKLVDLVPIWPLWLCCRPTWSRFHGGKAIDLPEILREPFYGIDGAKIRMESSDVAPQ